MRDERKKRGGMEEILGCRKVSYLEQDAGFGIFGCGMRDVR